MEQEKKGKERLWDNAKMALNVYLKTILATLLSLFLYMSIVMIFGTMGTQQVGYDIYEGSELVSRVDFITSAPEGQTTTTPPEGVTTTEPLTEITLGSNQRAVERYSTLSTGARVFQDILAQALMLCILLALPYSVLWTRGDKDKNLVAFDHQAPDRWRGLKVGLLSAIPSFLGYGFLLLSKLGWGYDGYLAVFRVFNAPFLPLINVLSSPNVTSMEGVSWGAIAILLVTVLLVPLFCQLAYRLGYNQIVLGDKLLYKNRAKKKKS